MILLYSGALASDQAQGQPTQSLGGFVSTSPLPNGGVNNIFPDLSISDLVDELLVTRMIVLKNTTPIPATNLSIFTEFESDDFEIKIAGVLPAIAQNGIRFFEQLQNSNSLPFQATLSVRDSSNPITTESLASDGLIGIWISLSKKSGTINSPQLQEFSDEYIQELRDAVSKFKVTELKLKINYS